MDRRTLLGSLGVGSMGLIMAGPSPVAAGPPAPLDEVHEDCLKACSACAMACEMATNHCFGQVAMGKKEHAKPLRYLVDCSNFCGLSARNIATHSPLMALSCEACGEACRDTLAQVATFDSPEMKKVAEELKRCEATCRKMVAAMGHQHS